MPPANNSTSDQGKVGPNEKKNDATQRRGPKGYFQGSRKEFLESQIPGYLACKKGSRHRFWHDLYSSWWKRYPWRLNDDEEPPTDDPEEMARLASVAPGNEGKKASVERTLTGRLTQWFINHGSAANHGTRRDSLAWYPLLQRLHQIRNPRPRKRTTVQQFMLDYHDEVAAAFVSKYGDGKNLGGGQRMNFRNELAKTMLHSDYPHLIDELDSKAKAQHDIEMDEWNLVLEDISKADDVSRARDTLFDAVHPLLEAVGTYAGCYVTLIAGNSGSDDPDNGFFTAVHWWPGDHSVTKDWTQWDEDKFNSGVAGPFLTYAGETDLLSQAANKGQPALVVQTPQVSPPLTLPTAGHQAKYRPIPTKTKSSMAVEGTKKRKHTSKESPPIRYAEDSESEAGDLSGDGSSSGDSISPDAPTRSKRQRTSRITTRSSARASAPTTDSGAVSDSTSPVPAVPEPSLATPNGGTGTPVLRINTTSINPRLQPVDTPENAVDVDVSSNGDTPISTGTECSVTADTQDPPAAEVEVPTTTPRSPPSALLNVINEATVPTFLLRHGKGKREVNIFGYLKAVEDRRFQRVLYHYLRFEINDKSGISGSLPTAGRPVEIGQWSSRARPANPPDFATGKRTFTDFVNSVLAWWASIQPSWRTFERGKVSREVGGGWDILHAPQINGLLNIVMLVYWWVRILEEQKPEDGVRADYELFAEDVAWVISNLSN